MAKAADDEDDLQTPDLWMPGLPDADGNVLEPHLQTRMERAARDRPGKLFFDPALKRDAANCPRYVYYQWNQKSGTLGCYGIIEVPCPNVGCPGIYSMTAPILGTPPDDHRELACRTISDQACSNGCQGGSVCIHCKQSTHGPDHSTCGFWSFPPRQAEGGVPPSAYFCNCAHCKSWAGKGEKLNLGVLEAPIAGSEELDELTVQQCENHDVPDEDIAGYVHSSIPQAYATECNEVCNCLARAILKAEEAEQRGRERKDQGPSSTVIVPDGSPDKARSPLISYDHQFREFYQTHKVELEGDQEQGDRYAALEHGGAEDIWDWIDGRIRVLEKRDPTLHAKLIEEWKTYQEEHETPTAYEPMSRHANVGKVQFIGVDGIEEEQGEEQAGGGAAAAAVELEEGEERVQEAQVSQFSSLKF